MVIPAQPHVGFHPIVKFQFRFHQVFGREWFIITSDDTDILILN